MSKQNIEESVESRVCFEQLEDWGFDLPQQPSPLSMLGSRAHFR